MHQIYLQLLDDILFVSLNDIVEKEVNYSTKYKFQHNETDFFAWNEANLSMTTIAQNHFQNGQRMNNYKRNNYMASIKMLTIREFMPISQKMDCSREKSTTFQRAIYSFN